MKVDIPTMAVVNAGEIVVVVRRLREYLRVEGIAPTLGASACLMLFAAMLKGNGHSEQEGHNALDRIFRVLDDPKGVS